MFPPHSKVSVNLASIYGIKLASPALVTATKLKDPSWDPEKRLGMGVENRQYSAQAHKAGTPKVSVLPPDHPKWQRNPDQCFSKWPQPREAIK